MGLGATARIQYSLGGGQTSDDVSFGVTWVGTTLGDGE